MAKTAKQVADEYRKKQAGLSMPKAPQNQPINTAPTASEFAAMNKGVNKPTAANDYFLNFIV